MIRARFSPKAGRDLDAFVAAHPAWVVEGCYGRWMKHLQPHCTEMVFLNPGEATCLANCRARPWEPEKYSSKTEQDAKLPFLLDWVRAYYSRTDDLSLSAHRRLFDSFNGAKREIADLSPLHSASRDPSPRLQAAKHDGETIAWNLPVIRRELAKLGLDWEDRP